jgi:hypothetical protein
LIYDDGPGPKLPVRRRFEVNPPSILWAHLCYAALPHLQDAPAKVTEPLTMGNSNSWWVLQTAVNDGRYPGQSTPNIDATPALVWIWPMQNPEPARAIKTLRLEAAADEPLVICGLTLYHRPENPLRNERLTAYRITLPEAAAEDTKRWNVDVDLGVVARTYVLEDFPAEAWLASPNPGLGERAKSPKGERYLYVEVTANPGATLSLHDAKTGERYKFELGQAVLGKELEARPAGPRVEILERDKVWLHGQVADSASGQPTPVRLAFRSKQGRYIPPYGHRQEINTGTFQDYGADLKLKDTSFAYVDGTFQVELPVGDVYVELAKGFEYQSSRQKLHIDPRQRELKLQVHRLANLRTQGWVTADTHVHYLSPSTAVLEGQAEGLNLINLLAAQWGDCFTNVGDLGQGPLTSRDGETMVRMGTENRQHILGHLCLLGARGEPVYPLSSSGPMESYLGDPLWKTLANWADECRTREDLVISAHFPYPAGEVAADIVLGKVDAVELYPDLGREFNNPRFLYWYRCLNCGYRLPVVGGTDKMTATKFVGANRTYANLGQEEFTFANWSKAVQQGKTFMTSGPLLLFHADGHAPGEEIRLGSGGGTVEVQAEAKCIVPLHRLEIVFNGRVVASRDAQNGEKELTLKEKVPVPGAGWLAARCIARRGLGTSWPNMLAHTSPVYFEVPGEQLFSASGAAWLMTLIEGSEIWVESLATRPDPARFQQIRKVFVDARAELHRRVHAHGIPH